MFAVALFFFRLWTKLHELVDDESFVRLPFVCARKCGASEASYPSHQENSIWGYSHFMDAVPSQLGCVSCLTNRRQTTKIRQKPSTRNKECAIQLLPN